MSSQRIRLVVILAAAILVIWLVPESPQKWPIVLIVLGLPLILGLVPRNWIFGHRTPATLRSLEATWYRQNRILGMVMLAYGLFELYWTLR